MVTNNLKKLRMEKGTLHTTLVKKLDISNAEIYDIENNVEGNDLYYNPELIKKICKFFNIKESELFNISKVVKEEVDFHINSSKVERVVFLDSSTIMNHQYFAQKFLKYFTRLCITSVVYDEINRNKESGHGIKADKGNNAFRQIERFKNYIEFDFPEINKTTNDEMIYYTAYNYAQKYNKIDVYFVSDDKSHTSRNTKLKNFKIVKGKEFDELINQIDSYYDVEATKTFWTYLEKGSEASALRMDLEKIDLNSMNKNDITPLCYAITKGYKELFNALLRRESVDLNISGCAPLGYGAIHYAVATNNLNLVKQLSNKGIYLDLLTKDTQITNVTPIMIAASKGNIDMLKYLLDQGVSINQQDSNGNTALHKAAINNKIEAYDLLIEENCDTNIINNNYNRAVEYIYENKD
ncbi:MAG: ankyrin repeat domain-containing protein [bacterium]